MNTKEFMEKLEQDAKENNFAILEKIQATGKDPEAVYAIAKEAGLTDSFEVCQSEMRNMYESMSTELSDEELLSVAGGAPDAALCGLVGAAAVSVGALFI